MKQADKVAIARIVLSGRERLVTIQPIDDGFRLTTLRSAKEIREPSSALDKLNAKLLRRHAGDGRADHRLRRTTTFAPDDVRGPLRGSAAGRW